MEKMTFSFNISGERHRGKRTVCGVVGSGNLEVIIEEINAEQTQFSVQTSVEHYQKIWELVINDFVKEYKPVGLRFTLNDNGATPPVVSLRLRQAFEAFQGYHRELDNYLELDARSRIQALCDEGSFSEWLANEKHYSPHLAIFDLPGEADDGIVIGSALLSGKNILIAAQQKDFMGGAVGEIHGAKLTGLFKAAAKAKVAAVILLIDSGGVRLHEANAGEIAISETVRAIFEARNQGVMTIGLICGKNGCYGGMGIISACLDYLIINEIGRIGVSGADVIQAVKGIESFDAQNRALVWRVYGGKTRYLQAIAQHYVGSGVSSIRKALVEALEKNRSIDLPALKEKHHLLKQRLETTAGFQDEGGYLSKAFPEYAQTLFDMSEDDFLKAAALINREKGAKS
ncbi:putative propionyl-CoA carboxylase beta chain 5 [Legionella massiliensis]|uniref:Malonate decarboxylase acyl carrier protein n=1 Tax=Legionella massiliensis TaxID=1034943 RepID=A0A078KX41_9GAMM|nr:biotin-independent malonate decarboxylase subunit beta [Legionella massiliensis]CDZ77531.1 putative propionyl-CoA carboxylase beta chain 5 [Legionella massiliensis]CEE13269.1 Malonyl-S-ACP:biotin-protein carboxyltransferase MADC [Legionella massiliensis]